MTGHMGMKSILLLQKNDPSSPDCGYPALLVTRQPSAPESEIKMVNYRGDGKLNSCLVLAGSLTKPTLWFVHYRTPYRAFKMSSNHELTLGRETSLKLCR